MSQIPLWVYEASTQIAKVVDGRCSQSEIAGIIMANLPVDTEAIKNEAIDKLASELRCPRVWCQVLVEEGVHTLAAMEGINESDLLQMGFNNAEAENVLRAQYEASMRKPE